MEANAKIESAAHRFIDETEKAKRQREKVKEAKETLVMCMKAADIRYYKKGGLKIEIEDKETVKAKRASEKGSGVS